MRPAEILVAMRTFGLRLSAEGETIIVRPKGATPPELAETIRTQKRELLLLLRTEQEQAETDRLARADGWRPLPESRHPAYSILETCLRYGVALRIDRATGDLVVGRTGAKADEPTQPWRGLLIAIEAHLEAVATLVEAGWTLKASFPNTAAA